MLSKAAGLEKIKLELIQLADWPDPVGRRRAQRAQAPSGKNKVIC